MKYKVTHQTYYQYYERVNLAHNYAWLLPSIQSFQKCHRSQILIEPKPTVYSEFDDFFGNRACYFAIQYPHNQMNVSVFHEVELNRNYSIADKTTWEDAVYLLHHPTNPQNVFALQFALQSSLIPIFKEIREYALKSFTPRKPLLEATYDLTKRIFKDFKFVAGSTTVSTPIWQVFKQRKGVCQDFAHFGIACLRSIGLAARYVSGYIETIAPKGVEKLVGTDASHAWFAVYHPTDGWVDFDPTNNQLVNNQYITIAQGRDYSDIPPIKGVIVSSGAQSLKVSVDVERLK
jgi:transglutaminase-like putative cysteine protease